MLTEIYIEALLIDEERADQVWEAWDAREVDDQTAWLAWSDSLIYISLDAVGASSTVINASGQRSKPFDISRRRIAA